MNRDVFDSLRAPQGAIVKSVPPSVFEVLDSPGRPLGPAVRSSMEHFFGCDFSHVRIHTDARAAESAVAVQAQAYTVGRHIVFAAGRYAPHTPAGRRLLAHELTHVVQQSSVDSVPGSLRVAPPGSAAETEAEAVAERVASGERIPAIAVSLARGTLQRAASAASYAGTWVSTAGLRLTMSVSGNNALKGAIVDNAGKLSGSFTARWYSDGSLSATYTPAGYPGSTANVTFTQEEGLYANIAVTSGGAFQQILLNQNYVFAPAGPQKLPRVQLVIWSDKPGFNLKSEYTNAQWFLGPDSILVNVKNGANLIHAIQQCMRNKQVIDRLVICCHGAPGVLNFTDELFDSDFGATSLTNGAFDNDALIYIPGCNLAEGSNGRAFCEWFSAGLLGEYGGRLLAADGAVFGAVWFTGGYFCPFGDWIYFNVNPRLRPRTD